MNYKSISLRITNLFISRDNFGKNEKMLGLQEKRWVQKKFPLSALNVNLLGPNWMIKKEIGNHYIWFMTYEGN